MRNVLATTMMVALLIASYFCHQEIVAARLRERTVMQVCDISKESLTTNLSDDIFLRQRIECCMMGKTVEEADAFAQALGGVFMRSNGICYDWDVALGNRRYATLTGNGFSIEVATRKGKVHFVLVRPWAGVLD